MAFSLTDINSDLHQICRESGGLYKVGGDDATKKLERWAAVFQCALMRKPVLSKNFTGNNNHNYGYVCFWKVVFKKLIFKIFYVCLLLKNIVNIKHFLKIVKNLEMSYYLLIKLNLILKLFIDIYILRFFILRFFKI